MLVRRDLYPDSDPMLVGESSLIPNSPLPFPHQAKSWRKCVPVTLELTEVWRQADQTFISLLKAVRLGRWVLEWIRMHARVCIIMFVGGRLHIAEAGREFAVWP